MNFLILKIMKIKLYQLNMNKLLITKQNRGGLILPLVLLILLFSSCGIAVPSYLNPPVKLTNLSFYHAYNNDPNYARGYEFFYRIYDDDAITDTATVINEANSFFTESNLLDLLSSNRTLITDSDYKRILPVSDNLLTNYKTNLNPIPTADSPLMLVDPSYFNKTDSSKRFIVNIAITTDEGEISTIDYSPGAYPGTINFKRYVTENDSDFTDVTFLYVNNNQDDVPLIVDSPISVAFFVVLYGLSEQYVSLFSDVVYIGSRDGLLIN